MLYKIIRHLLLLPIQLLFLPFALITMLIFCDTYEDFKDDMKRYWR